MKIDWKSSRKLSYPLNILLFNLCRLWLFRNKTIWIFGAREGTKYEDNSRYMFEYVCREHREKIRAVWMANDDLVVQQLINKGYEAYRNSSMRGKMMQLRAGVVLYSHGLVDFGVFPLVGGSCCVALWHGLGFKRIYNGKYSGYELYLKKMLDHLFSWTYRNITPVSSVYAKDWTKKMFTLDEKGIRITGMPRNDAYKNVRKEDVLGPLGIESKKRVIIYMPTYRQPELGKGSMEKIVGDLYDCEKLDNYLTDTDSVFLVKLHPLTPHMNLTNRENFIVLDYQAVEDNQVLMAATDMLVTDFSSCFVDYALLNRPIIFYTPDERIFLEKSEQMENEFFELSALCKAKTTEELVNLMRNPNMQVVEMTNEIFDDKSIRGTCYSENVYNVICSEIGLNTD